MKATAKMVPPADMKPPVRSGVIVRAADGSLSQRRIIEASSRPCEEDGARDLGDLGV
jgi:hypothetical protein